MQSLKNKVLCKCFFCVNTSVSEASVWRRFLRAMFFCARDFCLTVRAFWRAEELRWVEKNFEEMREVDQCSDEMKTVEKNLLRWHVRSEKGWEELRWDEKSSHDLRWDEVWSVKCKCEVRGVKSAVWSVKKVFAWRCIAPGSRAGHVLGQQHRNSFAQSTHARAWLAHCPCKFYRWERSYSVALRQLPPRLVGYYWYSNTESYWTTHWIHWVASGSPAAWQLGWQVGRICPADS